MKGQNGLGTDIEFWHIDTLKIKIEGPDLQNPSQKKLRLKMHKNEKNLKLKIILMGF